MDDDFSFGASVWGTPNDPTRLANITTSFPSLQSPAPSPAPSQDPLDDYDDFLTPPQTQTSSIAQEDDFGDFGDFGEAEDLEDDRDFDHDADFGQGADFGDFAEDPSFREEPIPGPSQTTWEPLRLTPLPSSEELEGQIDHILDPVWIRDISSLTTNEDIRQVVGIGQILVTPERSVVLMEYLPSNAEVLVMKSWFIYHANGFTASHGAHKLDALTHSTATFNCSWTTRQLR